MSNEIHCPKCNSEKLYANKKGFAYKITCLNCGHIFKKYANIPFNWLLKNFKFYRRWIGGTWYQLYDKFGDMGLAGDTFEWKQHLPPGDNYEIIKKENW